jgi:hypothetical protein
MNDLARANRDGRYKIVEKGEAQHAGRTLKVRDRYEKQTASACSVRQLVIPVHRFLEAR